MARFAHTAEMLRRAFAPSLGLALLLIATVVTVLIIQVLYPASDGSIGDTSNAWRSMQEAGAGASHLPTSQSLATELQQIR